jgi:hypothetical protein
VDSSNDIKTNDFNNAFNRLKSSDKIYLIIRLQASFRGYLARKRVRRIKESRGGSMRGMGMGMSNFQMSPDQ